MTIEVKEVYEPLELLEIEIGIDLANTPNPLIEVVEILDVGLPGPPGIAKADVTTVAGAPSPVTAGAGTIIFVSNESGGAVLAFSDGTNWRRVTDRAIIS